MNELTKVEDMTTEQLGSEIRLLTRQARGMALSYGIQIGYRLTVAHERIGPHGWAEWLERETEFSRAAASRFEKLYEGYGARQGSLLGVENNFPTLEKISISNALRLLAIPEEEREEFAAEVDAEHISSRELEKAIRERDEAIRQREQAERAAKAAESDKTAVMEELKETAAQLRELESRPVEVAVQVDEEAVKRAAEEAREQAERESKEEVDKARTEAREQRDKAKETEKTLRAAMEELETAKKELCDAREKEAEREDTAELKKRLEAAESGAGEAVIYCTAAQRNMADAIRRVQVMHDTHPETAEKLAEGLWQILNALTESVEKMKGEWKK